MEYKLDSLLKSKNLTLSCLESLTAGLFSSTIASHAGASSYFKGGAVTYLNEVKEKFGVKEETLNVYGAVSSEVALEMACGAQKFFNTNIAISFTGNAGPTALEGKPVGDNYIGVVINSETYVIHNRFYGDRNEIRKQCVEAGIEFLTSLLEDL